MECNYLLLIHACREISFIPPIVKLYNSLFGNDDLPATLYIVDYVTICTVHRRYTIGRTASQEKEKSKQHTLVFN